MTRLAPLGIICVALACQAGEAGAVTHAQRVAVVRALEKQADGFDQKIAAMEKSARGFRTFMRCVKLVPVSQYGDPDHAFGFEYDDRNGTGVDYRPALGLHRAKRWPDYAFLDFAQRKECRSAATVPGGTADNARLSPTVRPLRTQAGVRGAARPTPVSVTAKLTAARAPSLRARVRSLHARFASLQRREARLEDMSERFDEWESCLSWVPVTEYGDPDGTFGYLQQRADGAPLANYRTAIAVDNSEWDDPDYEFLAFVGRDRPFTNRECGNEPGESVD